MNLKNYRKKKELNIFFSNKDDDVVVTDENNNVGKRLVGKKLSRSEELMSGIRSLEQLDGVDVDKKRCGKHKSKKPLNNIEKSVKKGQLKRKFLYSVELLNKISSLRVPSFLYACIKSSKLELLNLNKFEQKAILDIGVELNKFEIAIMFLLLPETIEELEFVKKTLISKQFIDVLFRNIQNDLIL